MGDQEERELIYELKGMRSELRKLWKEFDEVKEEKKELLNEIRQTKGEFIAFENDQKKKELDFGRFKEEVSNQKSWLNSELGRALPGVALTPGNRNVNNNERFERVEKIANALDKQSRGNGSPGDHTKVSLMWKLHGFSWFFVGSCFVWIIKELLKKT